MAAPDITNHSPATPSPGEEVLLSFSVNFQGEDWQLEYFDNGWKIMPKSAMVIYANGLVVRIPSTYSGSSMTVCFVVDPNSSPQYSNDYTFNIASLPAPEISTHSPFNPSPGEEVTLSFRENFLGSDLDLQYRSGSRWETMPKSEMTLYANGIVFRMPLTFNENTMTVRTAVGTNYSTNYTFNIALPKDRIQYNQNGTIRNMEAKYNHNGVIKDVECWYNHNGVLKKIQ